MTSSSPYPAEPIHDVAEFASFELFSPCVDETLWFFKDLLGMTETARSGNSVFLRGWEDSYKHSLKITEREEPGMGYAGWRAMSPQALDRRVAAITDAGLGRGWVEGEVGMGPAFEFTTPDGSIQRLNWEVDYYRAEPDNQSVLLNRRQRRPLTGVPLKHLDHINMLAKNVTDNKNFAANVLGFKLSEHIVMSDNIEGGAWLRLQTRSHDVAFTKDATGEGGRLHHVAFAYGTTQHLEDAADVLIDNGLEIEAGIARHGISQAQFLYVLEPGGEPHRARGPARLPGVRSVMGAGRLAPGHARQRDHLAGLAVAGRIRHIRHAEPPPDQLPHAKPVHPGRSAVAARRHSDAKHLTN